MSLSLARPLLRQPRSTGALRGLGRRFEATATTGRAAEAAKESASKATSTASEYAAKATDTAKQTASNAGATAAEYKNKAAQGLSRVTSAAGPAIMGAARGVTGALGRIGGRTGRLIGFIERQTPFVIYYSRVGLEMSKLVFQGQKMSPPSFMTFQSYLSRAWKHVRNPSSLLQTAQQTTAQAAEQPAAVLQQVRGLTRAQLVTAGVLVAECLGFFTVGEMIGRLKLIGYHGDSGAHH